MNRWLGMHDYFSIGKLEEQSHTDSTGAKPIELVAENPSLLRFNSIIDEQGRFNVEDRLTQINTRRAARARSPLTGSYASS